MEVVRVRLIELVQVDQHPPMFTSWFIRADRFRSRARRKSIGVLVPLLVISNGAEGLFARLGKSGCDLRRLSQVLDGSSAASCSQEPSARPRYPFRALPGIEESRCSYGTLSGVPEASSNGIVSPRRPFSSVTEGPISTVRRGSRPGLARRLRRCKPVVRGGAETEPPGSVGQARTRKRRRRAMTVTVALASDVPARRVRTGGFGRAPMRQGHNCEREEPEASKAPVNRGFGRDRTER